MRLALLLALALPLSACGDPVPGPLPDDDDVSGDDDDDTSPNGDDVPDRAADDTYSGDLSEGATMELSWASQADVACWAGSEDVNFSGSHVIYEFAQGADEVFYARVTPDSADLDLSLWAIQTGTTSDATPPDLPSAVSCDSSYDAQGDSNPGASEAILLTPYNDYRVLVGVAGAGGAASGAFTLEIWHGE